MLGFECIVQIEIQNDNKKSTGFNAGAFLLNSIGFVCDALV